jgi:hypothetical protein
MIGGLGALLASEIRGRVKRNIVVYGLYGLAVLLMICAVGFAPGALHAVLELHYGKVQASLIIAGGLVIAGLLVFAIAAFINSRRRPPPPFAATALAAAPVAASLLSSRKKWSTVLVGGVVILGAILGRQLFKGDDGAEGES